MSKADHWLNNLRDAVFADVTPTNPPTEHLSQAALWETLLGNRKETLSEAQHLKSCDKCRRHASNIQAAIDEVRSDRRVQPPQQNSRETQRDVVWVVAAASVAPRENLYSAVCEAADQGSDVLKIELDDGSSIPLFRIQTEERTVEPCFNEGRTVTVHFPHLGRQVVTRFGGVVIGWDKLRSASVKTLDGGTTIEIEGDN